MQFRLRPYIIYLILNLVHYLIQTYFYYYYVPIIPLSFVGLSVRFFCVSVLPEGFNRVSQKWEKLEGKWNCATGVAQIGTELELSHEQRR